MADHGAMILAAVNYASLALFGVASILTAGAFIIAVHFDHIIDAVFCLLLTALFFACTVMVGSGQWFPG